MADTPDDIRTLPFEKALAQLEEIVAALEKGNVPLQDSIAYYRRGEALRARCQALLANAEAEVEKITLGRDGAATGAEPLDVD